MTLASFAASAVSSLPHHLLLRWARREQRVGEETPEEGGEKVGRRLGFLGRGGRDAAGFAPGPLLPHLLGSGLLPGAPSAHPDRKTHSWKASWGKRPRPCIPWLCPRFTLQQESRLSRALMSRFHNLLFGRSWWCSLESTGSHYITDGSVFKFSPSVPTDFFFSFTKFIFPI